MNELFESEKLHILSHPLINNFTINPVSYVILGDEVLPLKAWLRRSFSGALIEEQRVFSYRLSRAQRTIENASGIFTAR